MIQEKLPKVRFIGKRYNGSESIYAKRKLWKDNRWFSILENFDSPYVNMHIGAKRIVNGCLKYWIGMFFLSDTNVPEGFEHIDNDEINLANFRLQGNAYKVAFFETHDLCLAELSKHNMIRYEDHWCFECFYAEQRDAVSTEKLVTMGYKISIH